MGAKAFSLSSSVGASTMALQIFLRSAAKKTEAKTFRCLNIEI